MAGVENSDESRAERGTSALQQVQDGDSIGELIVGDGSKTCGHRWDRAKGDTEASDEEHDAEPSITGVDTDEGEGNCRNRSDDPASQQERPCSILVCEPSGKREADGGADNLRTDKQPGDK